jgi:Tol biopolymer transport system component
MKLSRLRPHFAVITVCRFFCLLAFNLASGGEPIERQPAGRIYASIFSQRDGKFVRELVAIDPQTGKCESIAPDGIGPRLSPDGRTVAYWKMTPNRENRTYPGGEAWIKKLAGNEEPQQIWSGDGPPKVCWTADGKHVIVSQGVLNAQEKWEHQTWLVDPETSESSEMSIPLTDQVLDCSRSGDRMLTCSSRNSFAQLLAMRADGTEVTALIGKRDRAFQARYSLDDKKIAIYGTRGGVTSVYSMDADGKHVQVAARTKGLTDPQGVCWSPDAKRLAAVLFDWSLDEDGKKIRRGGEDNHFRIVLVDPDGSNAQELVLDRAVLEIDAPDWR